MDVDALVAKGAGKVKRKGRGKADKGNDKKTACFICGGLGDFARGCPQPGASGPSGGKGRWKQSGKANGKVKGKNAKRVREIGAASPDPDTAVAEAVGGTAFVDEGAESGWLFAVAAAGGHGEGTFGVASGASRGPFRHQGRRPRTGDAPARSGQGRRR